MIKVMGKCIKWTSISLTSILLLLIALLGFFFIHQPRVEHSAMGR